MLHRAAILLLFLASCAACHQVSPGRPQLSNAEIDLLGIAAGNVDAEHSDWSRAYDPDTGVWRQLGNSTADGLSKQQMIASCSEYLRATNRSEFSLTGYTSHRRLWVFIYGPKDPNSVGGGTSLWVDSQSGKVIAETIVP